jgi:hypothetical protein
MPLSDLKKAGKTFSDAVEEGRRASAELRANVKTVRRARFGTMATCGAVAAIFIILGTWGFFYSWSERRIDEWRAYYVREISGNDRIVSELSKSRRELKRIFQMATGGNSLCGKELLTVFNFM